LITYNLLLMAKAAGHYGKAGQKAVAEAPAIGTAMVLEFDGRTLQATVDQVHVPPGCDEHCIGTIFLREI
jgi:hypothetical protein